MLQCNVYRQIVLVCLCLCCFDSVVAQVQSDTQTIARGLTVPWDIEWLNRKEIVFSELKGNIKVVNVRNNKVRTIYKASGVANEVQSGLMGIALHDNFRKQPLLYFMYAYYDSTYSMYSRVASIRLDRKTGTWGNLQVIIDSIPAASSNLGGRLLHTNGYLYVTVGDKDRGNVAQNLNALGGKILRIHEDGDIPADNPFPNSPIWSYGHRNPQGLVSTPRGLMITEHGTFVDDEINALKKGGNYGWPEHAGMVDDSSVINPIYAWPNSVAPSGIDFKKSSRKKNAELFVASLKERRIEVIELDDEGIPVKMYTCMDKHFGRIRDVLVGKKYLYFSTSNCDIYGKEPEGNDRIVRVKWK